MITAADIMNDLETYIYKEVCATYGEKKAVASAKALFDCLWLNFRKGLMYIPSSYRASLTERNELIWSDFTGNNHHELAIKYRITLPQIYTIINKMRDAHLRKNQADLFPLPDSDSESSKPITLYVIEEYLPAELIKCGLSEFDAQSVAQKISVYLCQKFPGVSICISDVLRNSRAQNSQLELF